MKTHTIKTPTAELLIVEIPEGSEPLGLIGNSFFYYEKDMVKEDYPKSLTLATSYTLLGKPDEIREEDATQLIPMYFDYEKTAVEYLIEMIETEIYWDVNPFPYERTESEIIADNLNHCRFITKEESKFWEAQSLTFNRQRSIIFKKVTPKI